MPPRFSTQLFFAAGLTLPAALLLAVSGVVAKEKKIEKGVQAVVLPKEAPVNHAPVEINLREAAAKIDELVEKKLAAEKIKPNAPASDEVFLRRVYLDIIGRVPTKAEALAFLESTEKGKRPKLVNELLKSDGYVQNFYNYWADLLRVKSGILPGGQGKEAGAAYIQWLKDSLRKNKPYDVMARELLTAAGTTYDNGAVGFYLRDYGMPLDNMAVTTQVLLGTQMVCAQCHNHPFDKWTQMDYYQIAAHTFGMTGTNALPNFSEVARTMTKMGLSADEKRDVQKAFSEILFQLRYNHTVALNRALKLPHDYKYPDGKPGQAVEPVIPASFSKDGRITRDGEHPAAAYARWTASKENPRFTLVIANRLWKKVMGIGVIDPVDELTDSTVPSNPALMEFLEKTMKDVNYDLKAFLRILLNTKTYQREAFTKDVEPGVPYHFPGPLLRRMSAEQIWDSLVGLYKDRPDEASRQTALETKHLLTKVEWMDRTLNNQTAEELIDGAKQIAAHQKDLVKRIREGDAKANAKNQRKLIFEKVEEVVFNNGFQKLAGEVSQGTRKLAEETDKEFASEVAGAVRHYGRVPTMEEALTYTMREQTAAHAAWQKAERDREMKAWGINTPEKTKGYTAFADYRDRWVMRAADIRSPAPNGHFLRQFGQSDRELVENGNKDASVMQALMMMNGGLFRNLQSPHSVLGRALRGEKSADNIIDTIYLSTMSRHPSDEEKAALRTMVEGNAAEGRGDVLWTVLNTRQFLFIQ
jgi:hypothetical protein